MSRLLLLGFGYSLRTGVSSALGLRQNVSANFWWAIGLLLALLAGAGLRLVWVEDMEYKTDEHWTFQRIQRIGRTEALPWVGMPTSVGVLNPGLSLWTFVGLSKAAGASQPTDLAIASRLVSIGALVALVLFAVTCVPVKEREPWLWAAALAALNPLELVLHRKIWPTAIMPCFVMVLLLGWWHRDRRWGAFLWGLAGLLAGQLNPTGGFLTLAFALWAVLFDRRRVAWGSWLLGCCLAGLPLIPWVAHEFRGLAGHAASNQSFVHCLEGKFWLAWISQPLGVSLRYILGDDYLDFLAYPRLAGRPTYLVGVAQVALLAAGAVILVRAGRASWRRREAWRQQLSGRGSESAFTQNAVLWGFGLLLTLTALPVHRHYLSYAFPFVYLWLARLGLNGDDPDPETRQQGRRLLLTVAATQLVISTSFLGYVHTCHRLIRGDYGLPYSVRMAQMAGGVQASRPSQRGPHPVNEEVNALSAARGK
jgi:hypothetical protein